MCVELRKLRSNEAIRGFTRYVKDRVCAELRKLRSNEAIRGFTRYAEYEMKERKQNETY